MINPAAMVGLQNDPAIKAIKGIQQGLFKVVDLRKEDRKGDIQEEKREYDRKTDGYWKQKRETIL